MRIAMRRSAAGLSLSALAASWIAASTVAAPADPGPALAVERRVLLMRHGVRSPTKANVASGMQAAQPWPGWDVPFGDLTSHGAAAIKLMGAYQRETSAMAGLLFASDCPEASEVEVYAGSDQRTIKTGEAFAAGFAPDCALKVGHDDEGERDGLFSPLEEETSIDGVAAGKAVEARFPTGLTALTAENWSRLNSLQRVLCGDAPAPCGFTTMDSTIKVGAAKPRLTGALGTGSSVAEVLMLEYADGKPLDQVGWGRVGKDEILADLALHPIKYLVIDRTPYIAARAAAPLVRRMTGALQGQGAKLTVLVGHDTIIADLAGLLNLHWQVADFPADDEPPGGALGFDLLRDAEGAAFVRAFFQSAGLDDIRYLVPLNAGHPASYRTIALPGCGTESGEKPCPLPVFERWITARLSAAP